MLPPLDPGRLNRKVRIQQQGSAQDASGQPLDVWDDVLTPWAQVAASTTRTQQRFSAAGFTAMVTYVVTIRFPRLVQIRSGMRLLLDGLEYDIQYVENPDGGRVQLNLYCVQRNDGDPVRESDEVAT